MSPYIRRKTFGASPRVRLISPPRPSNFRAGKGKGREGKDRGGERREGNEGGEGSGREGREGEWEGRGEKTEGRGKERVSPSLPYMTNTTLAIT